uniref:Elongation of fatty acids protein n=1 Tax=Albugo laibachii Nc14 TaxID=890382 RepID=F0WUN4_9STRA|nr:elongation of very long chain fatty acids protein pu [Albugo laibachii Nc14]|eukprot:CCA25115.1 elongation of very long chain fatty acids protein pu [Albugo laibachii Nc14]
MWWAEYKQWADTQEYKILSWFDESEKYMFSPMRHYPLADFATAIAICVGYISFVMFGTIIMKAACPRINTRPIQFLYNPIQVVLCSYMCVEAGIQAYRHGYSLMPCNAYNHRKPVMGNVLYMFYLSKILDFTDTVFIVLGKKWNQLSFLHVYHHLTIFLVYFLNLRLAYDGDVYATIILNGFIHAIMYMYYFVSAHTRDIWWKKYLTTLQMTQFVLMNVQGYMTVKRSCEGMPVKILLLYLVYIHSLFWLFMNFFIKSYQTDTRDIKQGKRL